MDGTAGPPKWFASSLPRCIVLDPSTAAFCVGTAAALEPETAGDTVESKLRVPDDVTSGRDEEELLRGMVGIVEVARRAEGCKVDEGNGSGIEKAMECCPTS